MLRVLGELEEQSARAPALLVETFALLADGSAVKLSTRPPDGDNFAATLQPFVPPCQVAAAWNGVMSFPLPVSGAPQTCDAELLMQVRAKSSCDGFSLRVAGRRAPPDAVITGVDLATAEVLRRDLDAPGGRAGSGVQLTRGSALAQVPGGARVSPMSTPVARGNECAS